MNEQDQRVRDYYAELSMPEERMAQLIEATEAHDNKGSAARGVSASLVEKVSSFFNGQRMMSHKMATAIACASVLFVSLWMFDNSAGNELTQQTLREVALNHTTRLQPEFEGETLAMLDNSMHQLPFALVMPKQLDDSASLLGSRYCSLGGVLAAHVKLQDKETGKPMSLFVTSNAVELEKVDTQQQSLNGVDVQFWREGGLFFALAQRS